MTTLETLFSPMQKEKLRQAALVRTSCRSFAGAPDTVAFAALSYVVGRCALPGARLVLTPVDESLFTGTILGMGRITGCKMAAVVIACGTEALCRVNAGILGEAFVLEATALGLGTCWVTAHPPASMVFNGIPVNSIFRSMKAILSSASRTSFMPRCSGEYTFAFLMSVNMIRSCFIV